MALGSFDNIEISTKLVKDSDPGTVYSVSDFAMDYKGGRMVTTLILNKLDENGYRACRFDGNGYKIVSKRKHLEDTPANRAAWSKK